jgi:outer membrane immunogenic protein
MKMVLVASVLAFLGANQALAADLPIPAPLPGTSYVPIAAFKNWSGWYVGLNGGYASGSSDWTLFSASTGKFNTKGPLFGGTFGANFQYDRFVFGLEADFDWSGLKGSSSVAACAIIGAPFGAACETKSDWLSTGRVRLGYALDRILIFGTGGLALSDIERAITQPALSDRGVRGTWTVGGGIEFAITEHWTAKAEYLLVDFGKTGCSLSIPVCTGGSVSLTENVVRAGINYKFSW